LNSGVELQKQLRQKGQTLVGERGLQEHQMAAAASNSPRQFQHWVRYSWLMEIPAVVARPINI
jgi:hypothetical protein